MFLPAIKEPHYFASEYGPHRAVTTLKAYEALFRPALPSQIRGDASVMYLSSPFALPALMARRPDLKVIALVRNPVEMFISWHNHCWVNFEEDETDPERAWDLQETRSRGQIIPKLCSDSIQLEYRRICGLGTQIRRLFECVPPEQRLVVALDDLKQNAAESFGRIGGFLGLRAAEELKFLYQNRFSRPRSWVVASAARAVKVYWPLKQIRVPLKAFLNRHGIYAVESVFQRNLVPSPKPRLSPSFLERLQSAFYDEILLLEELLGRDFSAWRSSAPTRAGVAGRSQ